MLVWSQCFFQTLPKPCHSHRQEPKHHTHLKSRGALSRLGSRRRISEYFDLRTFCNSNVIENMSRNKKSRFRWRAAGLAWASSAGMVGCRGLARGPGFRFEFHFSDPKPPSRALWHLNIFMFATLCNSNVNCKCFVK